MGIRTRYDATNNILFVTALVIAMTREGIAVDALRVVFQNLNEATERVENKLIAISQGVVELDDSGYNKPQVAYTSLVGDIWTIIDAIRRLELLLRHVANLPRDLRKRLNIHFDSIIGIRNSFQHLDERIKVHFDTMGGSVYGDISWRFREVIGTPEILHYLISGISRVSRNESITPILDQSKHAHKTGVYDLEIKYIKEDSSKKGGKKVITYPTAIINLEEVINCINELIDHLETRYSRVLEDSDKTKIADGSEPNVYQTEAMTCDPPRIFRFKRATE